MGKVEYLVSVLIAALILSGMVAWTHTSLRDASTASSCRSGKVTAPMLKGLTVSPPCPAAKRG